MNRSIKLAFRNIRRSGVYSVINIVGLAMSLATCVFIVLWVQDERSYDRFHKDAEDIYLVTSRFKGEGRDMHVPLSTAMFASAAKEDFGQVEDMIRLRTWEAGYLQHGDIKSSAVSCYYSDPNFFDFFNFPIVRGNSSRPLRNPTDVVISERLSKELFGNEDPVDQVILLNNRREIQVTAVMKDMPDNTYLTNVDLVSLYEVDTASMHYQAMNNWAATEYTSYLKVAPGTDVEKLAQQIGGRQPEFWGRFRSFSLQPLVNLHLYNIDGEPVGLKTVRLFQWIALVILVIACINYVNLVTARASKRHREMGLKKTIGAKKRQLFVQLINEAVIMFALAIFIALILNLVLLPLYNQLSGKDLAVNLFDFNIWSIYIAMFLVVIALAGFYPAWMLSSFKPVSMMQSFQVKRGSNLFRRILVVTQFVASTALIVGTIALSEQMRYVREKDMGYDREQVLVSDIGNMAKRFDTVKADLEQQSSIAGVTGASENIMDVEQGAAFRLWEGKTSEGLMMYNHQEVDTSFVRVMGLTFVDGGNFTSIHERQFILNEAAVKAMGITDPIGKWADKSDWKIVGVVKDFHFRSLHQAIGPMVLYNIPDTSGFARPSEGFRQLFVRTRANNAQQAIAALEKVWHQYNPDAAFKYSFMDETFDRLYRSDIRTNMLFGTFAVIAILISCLGLFGLVVFSAELKTKEIGIRKVLGASILDIVKLISNEFLILICIAMLIAFPLAYWLLDNMLQDFAYRISISWAMFALAALITIVLTLLTVGFQAVKAANENPAKAIKSE
ncbi:MAG: ABC transporter permease [Tannerella sp.]|jgi:ABC-type lipoprotein release transport system permease subunit|nr:ABC transporter permease [Tannerella sp.]